MPFLLVPKRFTAQPQYAAPLENTHYPGACVVGSVPIELQGKKARTTTSLVDTIRACGRVRSVTLGSGFSDTYPANVPIVTDFTVFLYVSYVDAADAYQYILGLPAAANAQNLGISSSHASIGGHWGLLIGGSVVDSTEALPQNQLTAIVVKRNGSTVKLFRDGVLKATATDSSSPPAIASLVLNSYKDAGTFGCASGTYYALAGIDARAWSDGEVSQFSGNPWRIFQSPPRRLWVIPASGITLVGAASTQANASGTGAITQTHVLAGAASTEANPSSTGAISQTHILVGASSTQANAASTGSIAGGANLTVASCVQANPSSTGSITQTHVLAIANSDQANAASTGSISGGLSLTAAASTQDNPSSASAITQTHALVGATSVQANPSSTGVITQAHALTGAASVQANPSSTGAVTQTHTLTMAASVQDNIAAASAIVQAHILAAANSTQSNTGGTGAITISTGNLTAAPSTQINSGGTGTISMVGTVPDAFLSSMAVSTAIKKPGVPTGTPEWLKTTVEIVLGRRGNKITPPAEQSLTFSATPTKAECEALYQYTNSVRTAVSDLLNRLDS